jgi:hypothetical protein
MTQLHITEPLPRTWRAGVAMPGPTALVGDYRALPRISNSDLTRLKEEHLGYAPVPAARWATDHTRAFGKAFHQHLLEPESVGTVLEQLLPDMTNDRLTATDQTRLGALMQTVRQDSFCRRYLRLAERADATYLTADRATTTAKAERERVVLFTDPATQLPCKARLDLVYSSPKRQNALVLDFKTTSARTSAQFLQSCYDYDYDRQAAFYLDSLRHAESGEWAATRQFRFVFVGVMKQAPHRLFAVDASALPGFLEYGRKKYQFWLKKWQQTNGGMD